MKRQPPALALRGAEAYNKKQAAGRLPVRPHPSRKGGDAVLGLEEMYLCYKGDLFRYLVGLTHDADKAEELLSETFLQALQSLQRFEGRSSEKTWLFSIARNLWLQSLRKRRPTVEYSDLLGLYIEDTLADQAASRELLARVLALLAQCEPRAQRIVGMRVEGKTYNEIAEACGVRPGTARVIDYRTRQWLKEQLRKEGLL